MINKLYKVDYEKVVKAKEILEKNDIVSGILNYLIFYLKKHCAFPVSVVIMADEMVHGNRALYLIEENIGYSTEDIYNAVIEYSDDYFTLLNIEHRGLFNIMKHSRCSIVVSIKPEIASLAVNYIMNEVDSDCDGIVNMFDVENVSKKFQDRMDVGDDYSKLLKYVVDILVSKGLGYMYDNDKAVIICVSVLDLGMNRAAISKCIDDENKRSDNKCPLSIVRDTEEGFVWIKADERLINSVVQYICDKK
jgi:hypothetical protein